MPTRIFHWLLVLCIAGSFVTIQNGWMSAHEKFGLTILGLLGFRLIWGVIGYPTARFSHFVRGPGAIWAYVRRLRAGGHPKSGGHNPLGALSVIALLAAILTQALSGTLSTDDIFYEGPLYPFFPGLTKMAGSLHHLFPKIILGLVGLHLAAVFLHRIFLKEKLVTQMITGKAQHPDAMTPHARTGASGNLSGLMLMAVCILAAWSLLLLK